MEQDSKPFLHTRADGYTETPDGNLAVVMLVRTGCNADICWFQYRSQFSAPPVRVEWAPDDNIILLPEEVVTGLLRNRYARLPMQEEVERFLAGDMPAAIAAAAQAEATPATELTPEPPQAAPQAAETPAPVPAATPAPENAPAPAPVANSQQEPALAPTPTPQTPELVIEPEVLPSSAQPEPATGETPAPVDAAPAVEIAAVPPVAATNSVVKAPPKKK